LDTRIFTNRIVEQLASICNQCWECEIIWEQTRQALGEPPNDFQLWIRL
jgi:hypothetical protein